jgi:hypothetical protein
MFRLFWSTIVAMLWFRQRTALNRSVKSYRAWDAFVVKCVGPRPQAKESIEAHVKHAMAQAKADDMANVAARDKMRFASRSQSYTRAAKFLPRWAWSYMFIPETIAAGIGVGYLAHHNPDLLSRGLGVGVGLASAAWKTVATVQELQIASVPTAVWDAGAAVALLGSIAGVANWLLRGSPFRGPFSKSKYVAA